jgi:nucleotide-binding universal stress UspA family protein
MPDATESQQPAAMDTTPPARLHLIVGYDGSPPASRALDGAVRLLQGRDGDILVVYVPHVPSLDMMSADALAQVEADFDEIETDLRAAAAAQLSADRVAWEFQRRQGLIAEQLIAAASAVRDASPGDTAVIVVGSSSHVSHRIIGSIAVSLARHCPVPLVIVP